MSQNLTQPEEIDQILMAMAGQDVKADMQVSGGARSGGGVHGSGCDQSAGAMSFSCGAAHKKTAQGLQDP